MVSEVLEEQDSERFRERDRRDSQFHRLVEIFKAKCKYFHPFDS